MMSQYQSTLDVANMQIQIDDDFDVNVKWVTLEGKNYRGLVISQPIRDITSEEMPRKNKIDFDFDFGQDLSLDMDLDNREITQLNPEEEPEMTDQDFKKLVALWRGNHATISWLRGAV